MADVEMSDAPNATSRKADVGNGKGHEGKKKFEVKKVSYYYPPTLRSVPNVIVNADR
jgi:hypothetical protein